MSNIFQNDAMDFETMLRRREKLQRIIAEEQTQEVYAEKEEYQKADRGCTMPDFLTMVKKVVEKGMKRYGVEFIPDDGIRMQVDISEKMDHPIIYYNLLSRVPRSTDRKPRFRQDIAEKNADGSIVRQGSINSQIFDCDIQFNVLASDYSTADTVMYTFEDAMLRYSGFFKRNGVSEMYFKKQYTDEALDTYRQHMSVRSLVYRVTLERIITSFDTTIAEIDQL